MFKYISIILVILISACNRTAYFDSSLDIPNSTWDAEKAAVFDFTVKDSARIFDLFIKITNDNNYRYSNLWLLVKTSVKEGDIAYDTLEYFLADERGKWLGTKDGDEFSNEFLYKNKVRFPRKGKYSVEIIQLMRDEKLKGIDKVGFKIEDK
ncbi:MAG: gliding motility lipoprotein GldH [Bacteroidales bacterium]|nr:gliding motility lipoprotein GldH [Bacteroidales bacterium]